MAKREKRLCKWKEDDITERLDEFMEAVRKPKFFCKKCGRMANNKKWLHKPSELK